MALEEQTPREASIAADAILALLDMDPDKGIAMLRESSGLTAAIVRSYLEEDLPESFRIFNPGLVARVVAAAAGEAVRFRNVEDAEPEEPYIEIAPPEADPYLPRFSAFERVQIAPNMVLNFPAPEEIAASKMALPDETGRYPKFDSVGAEFICRLAGDCDYKFVLS